MGAYLKSNISFSYKMLMLSAFALITFVLFVAFITGPAAHYEISIYDAYPFYFWLSIFASLVLGIIILLRHAFYSTEPKFWLAGLVIIMLSNSIIFLLPSFRGYYVVDNYGYGSTDEMRHIGYITDIQLTGHFGYPRASGENFYPAFHMLTFAIASITNVDVRQLLLFSGPFINILHLVWLYILAQKLTKNRKQCLLVIAFASIPIYGSFYLVMKPMMYCLFMLPLLLFLYFSTKMSPVSSLNHMVGLILLIVSMPFYNPITGGLTLLIVFLGLIISSFIQEHLLTMKNRTFHKLSRHEILLSLVLFVTWFTWVSSFKAFEWQTINLLTILERVLGLEFSLLEGLHPIIPRPSVTSWLIHTFKTLGANALYCSLSVCFILNVFMIGRKKKLLGELKPFLPLLITFFVLFLLIFVERFISSFFGFCRIIIYYVFLSILINGILLEIILRHANKPRRILSLSILIILIALPISVFNVHSSPWILRANPQVTRAEVQGMSWFLNNFCEEFFADATFQMQKTMAMGLLGHQNIPSNLREWIDSLAPDHFGYDKYDNYGALYEIDGYFLSNTLSRVFYECVIPQYRDSWRWTPEDFKQLESDQTVNCVYNNRGFEVFYIRGAKLV